MMFSIPNIYFIVAGFVAMVTGVGVYGKFTRNLGDKERRIMTLEDSHKEHQRRHELLVSKVFDKLDKLQEDVTEIRVELQDKAIRPR